MEAITKYFVKKFKSEISSKAAYLKLCKWMGENIVNHDVLCNTYIHIDKYMEEQIYVYKLSLYASISEHESRHEFCNACKEFHTKFYINQQYNCDKCNMTARMKDVETKLLIKKEYRKETLKHKMRQDD